MTNNFRLLTDLLTQPSTFIPTGILAIDTITGGGIPVGHMSDIVGEKGLGKTTLALHTAARHLAADHPVFYIDSEFSFNPTYAARLIPQRHDAFHVYQQSVAEDVYTAIERAATTPHALIILDSINALIPSSAITTITSRRGDEPHSYDMAVGAMARLSTVFLKRVTPILHTHHSTLLIINQYRAHISTSALRGVEKKPAGFHYYHHCIYTRIELSRGEAVKDVGQTVIAKVTKNKAAPSGGVSSYVLLARGGIDVVHDHVTFAVRTNLLTRTGAAWYTYTDPATGSTHKLNGMRRIPDVLPLPTIYHHVMTTMTPPSPDTPTSDRDDAPSPSSDTTSSNATSSDTVVPGV